MAKRNRTSVQFPLPIEGDIVKVQLPDGSEGLFDAVDGDMVAFRWQLAGRQRGYMSRTRGKAHVSAHRVIMSRILDRDLKPGEQVDHISGNTRDNRRSNLRLATSQQNQCNTRKPITNTSGYKGVQFRFGRYYAHIKVNQKMIHLGAFDTPQEAHQAYCEAAVKYFGEFARFE